MPADKPSNEPITDAEIISLIGESACASRPAPTAETLDQYLQRIAREDKTREDKTCEDKSHEEQAKTDRPTK